MTILRIVIWTLNKNSFLHRFVIDIFLFATALISLIVTTIVEYLGCKHAKLKSLVTSLALQQITGVEATSEQGRCMDIYCTCKIQWYTVAMLLLILLGVIFIVTTKVRKQSLFGGHLFSNVTKIMLFVSDAQSYVPVKLGKVAGSIHLFKIVERLMTNCLTLKRNWIWDVLDIDWREVSMTLHGNNINLPTSVILPLRHKFRIRWLVSKEPLLLHVMLK